MIGEVVKDTDGQKIVSLVIENMENIIAEAEKTSTLVEVN
jgi:hypothetical protein